MNKRVNKVLAAGTLTSALVLGGAVGAQAVTFYPVDSIAVSVTRTADRAFVVNVKGATFEANRKVTFKFLSNAFKKRFGDVTAVDGQTWTVTSNAEGGIDPFALTLPEGVAGTFTLTAVSEDATEVASTFSVSELGVPTLVPNTNGMDGGMIGLMVGGAAIVLAGGALVASRSRRQELSI